MMHHCQSENMRVVCEALNAMFDVYSEETYDKVLANLNVISTLESGLEAMSNKIEQEQDKYEDEEIEFFGETLFNLEQFLKYKHENMK